MIDTQKIADFLAHRHLASGLGTAEEPCSIAAINLALTGHLTDDIPPCMSRVVGCWIIRVQDAMPDAVRNSRDWKALLPLAAGTGRDPAQERRRVALLLDWIWTDVLPPLQSLADEQGFGDEWRTMLTERNEAAADAAAAAAAAGAAAADAATAAAAAAWAAAADAAAAAAAAAWTAAAAAWSAAAADAAADAADVAAAVAARAADAAAAEAAEAARADFWLRADPISALRRLVECC